MLNTYQKISLDYLKLKDESAKNKISLLKRMGYEIVSSYQKSETTPE